MIGLTHQQALDLIEELKKDARNDLEYIDRKKDKVQTENEMGFDTGRWFQMRRRMELINEAEK